MDELDRMYRRLVQNIRASFPDFLARPFEVSELYQTLIPYRHNRRELALETNQDYEMTLLRLLSGERGYLTGDAALQEAMRRELSSPNPDLSAFRAWATTEVRLADAAAPERGSESGAMAPAASGGAVDERPTAPLDAAPSTPRTPSGRAPAPPVRPFTPTAAPRTSTPLPAAPPPSPSAPAPLTLASAPTAAGDASPRPQSSVLATGGSCRYCGGTLPDGRHITFCPHCGQNLTVRHCPACGTELEVGWRFCTTCGRDVGAANG